MLLNLAQYLSSEEQYEMQSYETRGDQHFKEERILFIYFPGPTVFYSSRARAQNRDQLLKNNFQIPGILSSQREC